MADQDEQKSDSKSAPDTSEPSSQKEAAESPPKAAKKAVESSVPPATIDLNLQAFEKGYEHFHS